MRGQQLVYIVFIMAVNKQVLDHLEHCLEDNPDTDSLTLEFMYLIYHIGSSPICSPI